MVSAGSATGGMNVGVLRSAKPNMRGCAQGAFFEKIGFYEARPGPTGVGFLDGRFVR